MLLVGCSLVLRVYANLLETEMLRLKTNHAVYLGEERIVFSDTDVIAGMEMRSALANQDVARKNELTVSTLGSKTLRLAVTAVSGTADAFFMCKKL